MGSLLIWLSGARADILAHCKHDRAKYLGVGSSVLMTSSMAAVSMSFALHIALDAGIFVAIPFALAWGLAIMSLDRWLASLVRQPPLQYFLIALPRLLLGLLFGIIISTPLTLQIFHVEIDNQITLDHTNALAAYTSSPAVKALTAEITADANVVSADQQVINSGGVGSETSAAKDPTLVTLQAQLASDQNQARGYYKEWHCDEYGGSECGGYVVGNGPTGMRDLSQYMLYMSHVATDNDDIVAAGKQLDASNSTGAAQAVTVAKAKEVPDQAQLASDRGTLDAMKSSYTGTLGKDEGILASLKALDELRSSSSTLMLAELLIFLFFTVIAWLPVLVKALLNLGPENTYEKLLHHEKLLRSLQPAEPGVAETARTAWRLVGITVLVLPAADQPRYLEEFRAELADIAQAGHGRLAQTWYAIRLLAAAWPLRGQLRSLRQRARQ